MVSNHSPWMRRETSIAGRLAKNGSRTRKASERKNLRPNAGLVDGALEAPCRCRHG